MKKQFVLFNYDMEEPLLIQAEEAHFLDGMLVLLEDGELSGIFNMQDFTYCLELKSRRKKKQFCSSFGGKKSSINKV